MSAIYPKEKLISRYAKRLYNFESLKAIPIMEEINTLFISELFNDESNYNYMTLYNHYLSCWIFSCNYFNKAGRLKYCKIDENWFVDNYKPLEQPNL